MQDQLTLQRVNELYERWQHLTSESYSINMFLNWVEGQLDKQEGITM